MSVEVVGCVALFVEGEVFFILQEPETVSKMGYIGKYFAKLFKGWVALMSTSSIFLVFIPLLLPNKFNGQAAVPAWCIWLGAAFCFLVANFMAWRREVRRAETAESKLHEISHATPRMKLKEPNPVYCETITQTFTAVPSGQIVKQRQDTFLKIRFVNDPRLSVPSSKATVIATIDYYSDPDNIHLHSLDGRWADSTQPSAISPLESKIHLLPATFLHGQQRSLDIAFCDGESGKYYAWNNDNYNAGNEFYVYPKHLLVGLRFRVAIRLRGDWVDKKVSCIFGTKDKGFVIESYEEE